jgi:hypothetical protein
MGIFGKVGGIFGGIGKTLGINGAQGEYFNARNDNQAMDDINDRNGVLRDRALSQALQLYGQGEGSLADAMTAVRNQGSGAQQDAAADMLAIDPMSGSRFAADQLDSNPLLSRLYGSGDDSALSRALAQEQELSSRGYSLQPEDHEAYGQALGEITRQFGASEQNLAQALAARGMAAAPNGVAASEFSGLMGNKNEQLSRSQMDIAQRRMDMNRLRLRDAQADRMGLAAQGTNALQEQYDRQLSGVQQKQGALQSAAQLKTAQNQAANQANAASMESKQGAKGMTLGQAFGTGLLSSAGQVGAAPGKFVSSFAGSAGKSMGGAQGGGVG